VTFHGEIVYKTRASEADLTVIGPHMAGHQRAPFRSSAGGWMR
jgi:hypothetical protein